MKVLPLPLHASNASEGKTLVPMSKMLMPMIREIPYEEDMADSDEEEEENDSKKPDDEDARPSRRKQKVEEAQEEMKELTEMRHTLAFLEEYNQGLLPALKKNPKDY